MDPLDFIRARRSIRQYTANPIPREVVLKLLEAARLAPSARNSQPWKFIIVTDPGTIRALADLSPYKFIANAPLIIVACALPAESTLGPVFDVAIALDHISLAAASLGIGSCWMAGIDRPAAARLLNIPEGVQLVSLMTFGYPAEKAAPLNRKTVGEIYSDESF